MNLSFAQCETILNTLPIGYYTGRRIGVSLDAKEPTSFYSPIEDTIVVSYPIIAQRLKNLSDTADTENAVRSMLYHEVSHAILTPRNLTANRAMNIFEDERIESVLRNYYLNVNFKQQLYDLYGGAAPEATTGEQAFFNAVRFGYAPKDILKDINTTIQRFSHLHRNTSSSLYSYASAVDELYRRIAKDFNDHPEKYQPKNGAGKGTAGEETSMKAQLSTASNEEGDQDQATMIGDNERNVKMDLKSLRDMIGKALNNKPEFDPDTAKQLQEFTKTAEMIIQNFNKKNKGGAGINAYSGVFNPRALTRNDYRFFERSVSTQGNNKFGTCHLNLFIDCSGSFWESEAIMNGIIASLTEIERKNKNFSMDISFINDDYIDCKTVRDRAFKTCGGNDIPSNMKDRFLQRQKNDTCNYNIVLFDGDAFSDCSANMAEKYRRFRAFDYKQTTLITDKSNERYLNGGFAASKVVITKKYTDELINHLIKALMVAFG